MGAPHLVAVDLGVKTGLAIYGDDGRLTHYRSHNFGARRRLARAIPGILKTVGDVTWLITEGDRDLGELWARQATRRGAQHLAISAEVWRRHLLLDREQRTGHAAKQHADRLARAIIAWSGAPRPTALRHDTAEAILIGFWGVLEVGWLTEVPLELSRGGLTAQGAFGAYAASAGSE